MFQTRLFHRSSSTRTHLYINTSPENTRYVNMLLQLDQIPQSHNIFAFLSTYILLAGYLVFPGTFTTIRNSSAVQGVAGKSHSGKTVFRAVQHVSLLVIAAVCCFVGVVGICWLWWTHRDNFIWLKQKIFLPALSNSVTGLVTTLINIYTARNGSWSVTAVVITTITSFFAVATLSFFSYYYWLLDGVQKEHEEHAAKPSK
ncbi:hypothetical protein K469DRAFT_589477 [Zopfia rhizophila CBS 207.26]|uniref:Uncharacterized protein n=1 Tax=Zopfia rhizophila CBS 207.26 TaxID=1314779 RepID=A0A6A6DQJ6_9PEZI|nr:hypothetical protein K469DRAFT_589477 [Zopfia rhizophila CBS 207.26]